MSGNADTDGAGRPAGALPGDPVPHSPNERPPILVVDDEEAVLDVAVTILEAAGYIVVPAHNGHEAFRLFMDHPEIALLFTDIVMPGIDGFKLAGMVRMMRPATRLLFATGYMDLVPLNPAFLKGELINKPYRAADLEAAVEKVLSRPA